jgi:hypothetical protein
VARKRGASTSKHMNGIRANENMVIFPRREPKPRIIVSDEGQEIITALLHVFQNLILDTDKRSVRLSVSSALEEIIYVAMLVPRSTVIVTDLPPGIERQNECDYGIFKDREGRGPGILEGILQASLLGSTE